MTAVPSTFMKTNYFQDGQAQLSIVPGRVRNLIDSIDVRMPYLNVMDPQYGALNTGATHPLSGVILFRGVNTAGFSLASWQAFFSFATALTNELDWCATQLAINTLTAVTGGTVYSPPGTGYWYSNASSAADGSGTLTFPETFNRDGRDCVNWYGGPHFGGSIHFWNNDLGAGRFGVTTGNRAAGTSEGMFQGVVLIGPGVGSTLNASSSSMTGIGTNDRRCYQHVSINGFKVGIDLVGGQCIWINVNIVNAFYGVYWSNPQADNFGNMTFIRCVWQLCNKAVIGFDHRAASSNDAFYDCFLGVAPYSLFKETNSGAPTQPLITSGTRFHNCQFENVGNSIVCDDRANPAARVVDMYRTTFYDPQYLNNATYKIAAIANYAVFDIFNGNGIRIEGVANTESWTPGTQAMFSIQSNSDFFMRGDLETMYGNCGSVPMFQGDWWPYNNALEMQGSDPGGWKGRAQTFSGTVAVNDVLIGNGLDASRSAGSATEVPVGVAMYVPPSGTIGVMAYAGWMNNVKTTGAITANLFLRTGAAGAGVTGGTNSVVGQAVANNGVNIWNVILRGMNAR